MARAIDKETGEIIPAEERVTALERVRSFAGLPARYELPAEVAPAIPENARPFRELINGPEIVLIGTHGEDFEPTAGMGYVRRVIWQFAQAYPFLGPDRDDAFESLVPATSIPARLAAECQETGKPVRGQVTRQESRSTAGQTFYQLVPFRPSP